jgi:putative DNA primase/helicase
MSVHPGERKKPFLSSAEIHQRVEWPDLLPRLGIAGTFLNGKHGPCPACGGKDRFRFDDKFSHGDYICSQPECGPGDGFRLVQLVNGCDFSTARALVMQAAGLSDEAIESPPSPPQAKTIPNKHAQRETLSDYGLSIWRECSEIGGAARDYLLSRRCRIPPNDGDLRWHPNLRHPSGYVGPALVGLITDSVTNEAISLHRTWVQPNGSKAPVNPARMLLKDHKKAGGVIRLWPDECATYGLSIAEGIETSLAAAHGAQPIWSTIDAGNMAAFRILPGIDSLTIFADNDEAGRKAAKACAERWATVAEVMIVCRDEPGFDIADAVAA